MSSLLCTLSPSLILSLTSYPLVCVHFSWRPLPICSSSLIPFSLLHSSLPSSLPPSVYPSLPTPLPPSFSSSLPLPFSLPSLLQKVFQPVLLDLQESMQTKTIATSGYEQPIQVLAELLEIRTVPERGGSPWPMCELVCEYCIGMLALKRSMYVIALSVSTENLYS